MAEEPRGICDQRRGQPHQAAGPGVGGEQAEGVEDGVDNRLGVRVQLPYGGEPGAGNLGRDEARERAPERSRVRSGPEREPVRRAAVRPNQVGPDVGRAELQPQTARRARARGRGAEPGGQAQGRTAR